MLSGIISCIKRWYRCSDVPPEYGCAKTLYNRYKRWSGAGIFERVFATLARETAELPILMIDASHVKTHRIAVSSAKNSSEGRCIGKTKGGLNSKLHLARDGDGCTIIAARGYDANHLRDWLKAAEATSCIPPRKSRKVQLEYDVEL